ncbi:hypothetical protein [Mycolicibacterium brumae]|uniref:hypothetical protein n=1 Tax=Mycolicibacterium brumae TaxID=85968 RepID=UPI000A3DF81B|nr:hypothetical protein [Mycolicibacterium brumae]MCV7193467.1 hypothetical protein [Mycolicibacterium brumae]RWA17166.1 hypothetical protein MBRU_05960 [Mycolicibacterium brumae DSM 44177]UWW09260.1 hypothetical protein L2Z93_002353 [Mycolicibacterium brumae]
MTNAEQTPGPGDRAQSWLRKGALILITVALLIGAYFLGAAFLPRWWAQQIGHRVGGSFSGGVGIGLTIGFVCTVVPIVLVVFAILWRRRWNNVPTIACLIGAAVAAVPNLLTLAVVLGTGNAAHAGERVMDVDAPAFRGASLWGAIAGAAMGALVAYLVWGYRRRGRKLHAATHPD